MKKIIKEPMVIKLNKDSKTSNVKITLDDLLTNKKYRRFKLSNLELIINGDTEDNKTGYYITWGGYCSLEGKFAIDKATILYNKWHKS